MRNTVEIEDIQELRRQEGIEDVELRQDIRGLRAGDLVKLTFRFGVKSCETVLVRITSFKGSTFRGKLAGQPTSCTPPELGPESLFTFTTAHIHSVARKLPSRAQQGSRTIRFTQPEDRRSWWPEL